MEAYGQKSTSMDSKQQFIQSQILGSRGAFIQSHYLLNSFIQPLQFVYSSIAGKEKWHILDLQDKIAEVQTPNSRQQTIESFAQTPCNETTTPSHKTFSLLHHHMYTMIASVPHNHLYTTISDPFPVLPLSAPFIHSNLNPCNPQLTPNNHGAYNSWRND